MPVRLTRRGVERTGSDAVVAAARQEFADRHSLVLRGFVDPFLLSAIQRRLRSEPFLYKMNEGIGTELRLPSGALSSAL